MQVIFFLEFSSVSTFNLMIEFIVWILKQNVKRFKKLTIYHNSSQILKRNKIFFELWNQNVNFIKLNYKQSMTMSFIMSSMWTKQYVLILILINNVLYMC